MGALVEGIGTAFGASKAANMLGIGPGGAPSQPGMPQTDPRLTALRNRQLQTASDYRGNADATKQQEGDIAAEGINTDVAGGLKNIKAGANSRGLLYSGLRSGEEANLMGGAASRLDAAKTGINNAVDSQANAYDAVALGQNYAGTQAGFGPSDIAYNAAVRQRQGTLEADKSIGQGIGQGIGTYYGYQQNQPKQTSAMVTTPVQPASSGLINTSRYA